MKNFHGTHCSLLAVPYCMAPQAENSIELARFLKYEDEEREYAMESELN